MSLLKQILSPFVEFEDNKKKVAPAPNNPAPLPEYRAPAAVVPDQPAQHPLLADLDPSPDPAPAATPVAQANNITTALPEHKLYFQQLIDKANSTNPIFQGADYKEFVDSKLDIDNISDEETKYKTAFNILKKSGLTKQKLISTAQEYRNIVGRDLNTFQAAHFQQYQKQVRSKEEIIQSKAEEIQTLNEKVNALKKEISTISQDLMETKNKLNLTKNSFLLAGEQMQQEIQHELDKIDRYF
jgi:hypothetical protein